MSVDIKITEGSPNVFADLGLSDADELLVKAELARQIALAIKERDLKRSDAAKLISLPQR